MFWVPLASRQCCLFSLLGTGETPVAPIFVLTLLQNSPLPEIALQEELSTADSTRGWETIGDFAANWAPLLESDGTHQNGEGFATSNRLSRVPLSNVAKPICFATRFCQMGGAEAPMVVSGNGSIFRIAKELSPHAPRSAGCRIVRRRRSKVKGLN